MSDDPGRDGETPATSSLSHADRARLARNVRLIFLFRFLREAQIWIPVWIVYLVVERGFSLTQVGAAEAVFLIGVTTLEVPTGAVADRWGRRMSLALGATTLVMAIAVFGVTTSFPIMLVSFLLWSAAETLVSGADLALLYDSLRALGREHEYEKLAGRGEASMWAGVLLGVLVGAPIAAAVSIQFTIFVGAATAAVAILAALAMTEAPHRAEGETASYLAGARQALTVAWSAPAVRWMIVYGAVLVTGLGAAGFLLQPLLLEAGQEVGFGFSLLQVPGIVAAVVGSLLAFRLVSRAGPVAVLAAIPVLGLGSYVALALIDHLAVVGFFSLVFLARSAVTPIATGYINRRVPSAQRATILSLQSLLVGLLLAPLSVGVGLAFDEAGLQWAFAIPAIALGGMSLVGGALWVRAHRREPEHAGVAPPEHPHSVIAASFPPPWEPH